jgi:hypothetical protein
MTNTIIDSPSGLNLSCEDKKRNVFRETGSTSLKVTKGILSLWPAIRSSKRAKYGGESEIRTHDPIKDNGFQDRRNRPLCHLSPNLCCFILPELTIGASHSDERQKPAYQ